MFWSAPQISDSHHIVPRDRYQPPLHLIFLSSSSINYSLELEMLEKKNFLSAKKDPKQFFGSVPSSGTTPEMNGVYSDVRHILHLSLVDICLVIVVSFC